jgi:hypothetical protein
VTKAHKTSSDWRRGTKRRKIAELAEAGISKRNAYAELKPLVDSQTRPMVFSKNEAGRRIPKPLSEQLVELKNEIGRVYAILGRAESSDFESEEITPEPEIEPEVITEDEETEEKEKPVAKGKEKIRAELDYFLKRVREIRQFCARRAELSESLDSISMRPAQAAARLIPAGIPADALLYSMVMHWPEDARRDAGINPFDFAALSREIMQDRGITGNYHELFGYALVLAENRQPIMFVGPAGSGKSHIARQLAEYLELPYGETPMSPGATRGDLLGRHTIGGFIPSDFTVLYGGGGVFNFEEIDASDPSMLIVLNNALASQHLFNSANGERYDKSENFLAVSTANTFGLGANRDFTARERLDAATIDRWRMGRIFVPIDESIETELLYSRA